jgi:hypothetical protein
VPKDWVDRDDRVAGDCPAGPVTDDEHVAKLLNNEAWDAGRGRMRKAAFQQRELFPPENRDPNNTVGSRDGESLLRCTAMSNEQILQRAQQQSPNDCHGAALAAVGAIRSITIPHDPTVRLFRIYEDPTDQDPEHCVIRFDPEHEAAWGLARSELLRIFQARRIGG